MKRSGKILRAFFNLIIFLPSASLYAQQTLPILDGASAPVSAFPYVARLDISDWICSGTLVAPRYVLTAGHCVTNYSNKVVAPYKITVRLNDIPFAAKAISVHPSFNPNLACEENHYDVALIELQTEAVGIESIPVATTPPALGDELLIAGFGSEGTGQGGEDGIFAQAGTVDFGYTYVEEVTGSYINWRFNPGESNTGGGDSGGPAFVDIAGQRYVSNITCGGTGDAGFGTWSFNTRVDKVADWIYGVVNHVSAPTASPELTLKKVAVNVDFQIPDFSWVSIVGSFKLPTKFDPEDRKITLSIGSYSRTFILDEDGQAEKGLNFISLSGKRDDSGRFLRNKNIKFKFEDGNGALANALNELGFLALTEGQLSIPITIKVGAISISSTKSLSFVAEQAAWQ